jgi:hypothetical protein
MTILVQMLYLNFFAPLIAKELVTLTIMKMLQGAIAIRF